MNNPRILIPNTITWAIPELPLEVERFDVQNPPVESGAVALAVWGIPRKVLVPLLALPSMRWIQSLTAGIDLSCRAFQTQRQFVSDTCWQ